MKIFFRSILLLVVTASAILLASPQPTDSHPHYLDSTMGLDAHAGTLSENACRTLDKSDAVTPGVPQATWPDPGTRLDVVRLWPEGVPGAIANGGPELLVNGRVSNVHDPTVTVFPAPPDTNTGTAVIVCPGGGYTRLAMEHEGRATAEWLNSLGVSAFVLRYRLKEYGHPAPLRDVLRAVRLLRADAKRWNIAADRIGVLGFSAGGHLAASAGTLFDDPDGRTGAALDTTSARPDFLVLVYPVITMSGLNAHSGSAQALLGVGATPEMLARLSLESRVAAQTPPTFLVHGGTDTAVPLENSVLFYSALRRSGVPAELHVFQDGAHGVGLLPGNGPISDWPKRCAEWMAHGGLLGRPAASAPAPAAATAGPAVSSASAARVTEHVPFRTAPGAAGTRVGLTLDVYEPAGDSGATRPAVIWVHGGCFRPGVDKRQGYIVTLSNECARRRYVSVAPDYRVRERKDVTVPYAFSVQLADELKAQQIPMEFLSLPNAVHTPVDRMPLIIDTVAAFLARVTR